MAGITIDVEALRSHIREIPDFPQPGVSFKDVTPLLLDHVAFSTVVDAIVVSFGRGTIDKVVGIEARGFILAAPVAYHFGAGFVPLRKRGKLPGATWAVDYELEYGVETLEVHEDAIRAGDRVLIVDDVLATGGTARAAIELVERAGGTVSGLAFLIELAFLDGAQRLAGHEWISLLRY
ncbi:MAG TPA: adenine phosphoribosyltransferase [Nitriliruptorales bacterium]|nr:adenine phosphoribosyltransferase [Nitriliruptorales bacterium]